MQMITQHTIDTPYMVGPVHCYSLEHEAGLILFDAGPPTDGAREYFHREIELSRLKHVLITHCHIDHYGLARWLEQESDAIVYLPHRDGLKIAQHARRIEMMHQLLAEVGFDDAYLNQLRQIFESGVLFPPFPERYRIAEHDLPPELGIEVVPCPGHSQSDLVYVHGDEVVSGDTLLRGIFQSPLLDVDLETGERFNNYRAYCTSIVRLAALNGKKVLPGHRQSVESVRAILHFYLSKMLIRVEQLLPVKNETNVASLIATLFNNGLSDVFHIYLKASEILFMQDFLAEPELLEQSLAQIGLLPEVAGLFAQATGR